MKQVGAVIIIGFACLTVGLALKCYSCTGGGQIGTAECFDDDVDFMEKAASNKDIFAEKCSGVTLFGQTCSKELVDKNGVKSILRGCAEKLKGLENTCKYEDGVSMCYCDTDLCNAATTIRYYHPLVFIMYLIICTYVIF